MRRRFTETTVLLISTFKWSTLAGVVGIVVGLSTTAFLKVLNRSISLSNIYSHYYLLLPFIFFLNALIIRYLCPSAEGHGTEKVIEAIHKYSGRINPAVIFIKPFTAILTISFGGSAGKEGPCAQIGGSIASFFSDILRLDDNDRKKLVICGISAGFSSVFGTPVAGSLFGIEVLFIGSVFYDALLPSFVAGIVSYYISSILGSPYFYSAIEKSSPLLPGMSSIVILKIIVSGILFGAVSMLMIETMRLFKKFSSGLNIWFPLKGMAGGCLLVILTLIFSTRYLGLGSETVKGALEGKSLVWYAFILKIIFTAITLNFWGSGGIIFPLFFVGATSGVSFSNLMGMDRSFLSAIGLVSVLAGAANTPISASVMAIELFGKGIAPYAALSCIVSFLITGHRSVYPSQILGIRKTPSINIEVGSEIDKTQPHIIHREKSLISIIYEICKKMRRDGDDVDRYKKKL
ncbi:MAG TPA: chloride channel protein [bacterium]|nr:chloride channel protein [bacterium]HPP30090.1 chloride channel protein [bacterium]